MFMQLIIINLLSEFINILTTKKFCSEALLTFEYANDAI